MSSLQSAVFLKSAAYPKEFPPDTVKEVAFIGRSNSGKSTAINVITGIKKLARTSKTPGRTQLVNFFTLNVESRIVDLPGYGYAKVSDQVKQRWQKTIVTYLEKRKSLKGLVLIMDIRHPLKPLDKEILDFAAKSGLAVHILLTKCDKISRMQAEIVLKKSALAIADYSNSISIQLFSSVQKTGIVEAREKVGEWLLGS